MNFAEHVVAAAAAGGTVDLAAAEDVRACEISDELASNPATRDEYARKAAKQERSAWERAETTTLRKQFGRSMLTHPLFDLDPDVLVPLGGGRAVRLGSMTRELIAERKAMRFDIHRDEEDAYDAEMAFWAAAVAAIAVFGGGTVDDARAEA